MKISIGTNFVAVFHGMLFKDFTHLVPQSDHENNLLNPNMNNLHAIDYLNKEITVNHDICSSLYSQEFPKYREGFTTKADPKKPWGENEPKVYDVLEDSLYNLGQ